MFTRLYLLGGPAHGQVSDCSEEDWTHLKSIRVPLTPAGTEALRAEEIREAEQLAVYDRVGNLMLYTGRQAVDDGG